MVTNELDGQNMGEIWAIVAIWKWLSQSYRQIACFCRLELARLNDTPMSGVFILLFDFVGLNGLYFAISTIWPQNQALLRARVFIMIYLW